MYWSELYLVVSSLMCATCFRLSFTRKSPIIRIHHPIKLHGSNPAIKHSYLLSDLIPNSIGNFYEHDVNTNSDNFIQCYMIAIADIDNAQYGVGYPIDMPVALTYFDKDELKPVKPDHPDYDHLINHVSTQLEGNDLSLFRTPVVLTLQGEFEDEDFNVLFPTTQSSVGSSDQDSDGGDYEDDTESEEVELTLSELMAKERRLMETEPDDDEDDEDGDDDDDEEEDGVEEHKFDIGAGSSAAITSIRHSKSSTNNQPPSHSRQVDENYGNDEDNGDSSSENDNANMSSFYHDLPFDPSPSQKDALLQSHNTADVSVIRGGGAEQGRPIAIPEDAIVTAEDTRGLNREHKFADRIISHATDMTLMGSFHYKKRNFHLVRLLEPIVVMGRRRRVMQDGSSKRSNKEASSSNASSGAPGPGGYCFDLLSDAESDKVRPELERLLAENKGNLANMHKQASPPPQQSSSSSSLSSPPRTTETWQSVSHSSSRSTHHPAASSFSGDHRARGFSAKQPSSGDNGGSSSSSSNSGSYRESRYKRASTDEEHDSSSSDNLFKNAQRSWLNQKASGNTNWRPPVGGRRAGKMPTAPRRMQHQGK